MGITWFSRQAKRITKKQRLASACPRIEVLEERLALATRVWDGNALSNNWSNRFNWVGDVAPVSGDDLVFPGGTFNDNKVADNNMGNGFFVRSITFLGHGFTLKGNSIALGFGGIIYTNATSSGSNTIQNDIQLTSATATILVNKNLSLNLNGNISGTSSIPLTKTGGGNLTLAGNNSYTGVTNILDGGISARHQNALGTTINGTNIGLFASLGISNDGLIGRMDFSEGLTFANGFTGDPDGSVSVNGKVDLHSDISITGGVLNFSGDITYDGQLTTTDNLTMVLDGKLKYLSPLVLSMTSTGVLTLDQTGAGGNYIFSNRISGNVGGVIVQANVLYTGNLSNTYVGDTDVQENGILTLGKTGGAIAVQNLFIRNDGTASFERDNQIPQTTVLRNFGKLLLNGNKQTISGTTSFGTIDTRGKVLKGSLTILNDISGFGGSFNGQLILGSGAHNIFLNNVQGAANEPVLTIFGDVSGTSTSASINKLGGGRLVVEGKITLSTNTNLLEGKMTVNGKMENSTIVLNSNTLLQGKGTVGGLIVNSGATVKPALDSVNHAILRINGDINFKPGSILSVGLNNPIAGSGFDQLKVSGPGNSGPGSGNIQFNGAVLKVSVGLGNAIGDTFRVIENDDSDQTTGQTFATETQASVPQGGIVLGQGGEKFIANYFGGIGNNDFVLTRGNATALFPNRFVTPQIVAGGVVTLTGIVSDPDRKDTFILHINWGDGSPVETKVYPPSFQGKQVYLRHRYLTSQEDPYVIQLNWHDQRGAGNSDTLTTLVTPTARIARTTDAIFASLVNLKEKKISTLLGS
jgi:autotransporter-associated beta strand protein